MIAHFEETYHSYYLTSDLRDDGLIDPLDTRNALGHVAVGGAERADRPRARRRAPDLAVSRKTERGIAWTSWSSTSPPPMVWRG